MRFDSRPTLKEVIAEQCAIPVRTQEILDRAAGPTFDGTLRMRIDEMEVSAEWDVSRAETTNMPIKVRWGYPLTY